MSLFSWLRTKKPGLDTPQQQRLAHLPKPATLGDGSLRSQRWVVVDLETSGLNLQRDQLLAIGGILAAVLMASAGGGADAALAAAQVTMPVLQLGLPDVFIEHGDPARLLALQGLDAAGIRASITARFLPGNAG